MRRFRGGLGAVMAALLGVAGCTSPESDPLEFTVPPGASFESVLDTLETRGIVPARGRFKVYARLKGADRAVRSGRYALRRGEAWSDVVATLTEGRVVTVPMTVPEGYRLAQMVPLIAAITGRAEDEILRVLDAEEAVEQWGVPGPTLEGYLFPDTYRFAEGIAIDGVVDAMVARYRSVWTPERRARLEELGMSENELVTLASVIQAEARHVEEMPRISSVYHSRLERGMLLQADPTVLYALGGYRERLLFAAIDSVADNPYNTYRQPGLPPGPIGAPGDAAIEAALHPADEPYLYFVARPDGTHVFTRSLPEHNAAVAAARREWAEVRRNAAARPDTGPGGGSRP